MWKFIWIVLSSNNSFNFNDMGWEVWYYKNSYKLIYHYLILKKLNKMFYEYENKNIVIINKFNIKIYR